MYMYLLKENKMSFLEMNGSIIIIWILDSVSLILVLLMFG